LDSDSDKDEIEVAEKKFKNITFSIENKIRVTKIITTLH